MAEDKRTTPGADRARRRRAAPTIDLTATEVDPPPPTEPPHVEASQPEPPPQPKPEVKAPPKPRSRVWAYIGAGMAGGIAVAEIAFAWWLSTSQPNGIDAATTARIAALESQLRATPSQPAQPAPQPRDNGSNERLAAVEKSLNTLSGALAAFNKRSEEISSQMSALRERAEAAAKDNKEKDELTARIATLESAAKVAAQEAARNAGADNAARIALATIALRDAVMRGEPYAPRLAALKALGADAKKLTPLEDFATSGLPTEAKLASDLTALLPAMADAAGANPHSGFFARLQANAGKLVRVRPVGEPAGDDASAVLARVEIKAAQNDVRGVLADLGKLPVQAQTVAAPWSRAVAARQAALAAAQALADDSALALGKP